MTGNHIKKVAIIGAGGQIGKFLTSAVLSTGKHEVTVIGRPNSTSSPPSGVQVKQVDYYNNEEETVQALQGQHVLIITMSVTAPRDTVQKLVRAAAKAEVPYVFPNWYGHDAANKPLCDDSLLTPMLDRTAGEVKRLGVSKALLLNCNFWYEFGVAGGPDRCGFDIKKRTLVLFDGGDVPINMSTFPQCGRAVASLLNLDTASLSKFHDRGVYVSSFLLNQRDMFESVKRVTQTTDADWTITHESAEDRWRQGRAEVDKGNYSAYTRMLYSRLFIDNGENDGDYESRGLLDNELLGLPVEDLDAATAVAIHMAENEEVAFAH
ncbi:hypothetical protein F4778DRAFT_746445 [Xylariomycetidae sp. FL2044]|nr:hypothetical protein F4778DRAFT_746445 [Xylariomycetidae sp. FL2044]